MKEFKPFTSFKPLKAFKGFQQFKSFNRLRSVQAVACCAREGGAAHKVEFIRLAPFKNPV